MSIIYGKDELSYTPTTGQNIIKNIIVDTNYYGSIVNSNITGYDIFTINASITNFTNNYSLLGGGGGGANSESSSSNGSNGGSAIVNNVSILNLTNLGALLGGGGGGYWISNGGSYIAGFGGAGGGGGGAANSLSSGGNGGSIISSLNGEDSNFDAGGGGPTGNGGNCQANPGNIGGLGGNTYPFYGSFGGNSIPNSDGENALSNLYNFKFGGGGGASGYSGYTTGNGSGGGGYGGGNSSNEDYYLYAGGGGGGGGGAGGKTNYSEGIYTGYGGNGGYGILNNGIITTLNNAQGGPEQSIDDNIPFSYGPLFYGGNSTSVLTNYNIIINSSDNYGQLWNYGVNQVNNLKVNFSIDPNSYNNILSESSNIKSMTFYQVLYNVESNSLNGTYNNVSLNGRYYNFIWNLSINSTDENSYDLNIIINIVSINSFIGNYYTNPSPLLQKNPGLLVYSNSTFYPVYFHNYVLKNIYDEIVSDIIYVSNYDLINFTFENVTIPYGGINNLYIFDLTSNSIIVENIIIDVSNVCFKEGTKILCLINKKEKYIPIEEIKEDDYVKVYQGKNINYNNTNNLYKRAKFIIKNQIQNSSVDTINKLYLYKKENNFFLTEDLYITGAHAILYNDLTKDQLEKMNNLAEFYNNYEINIESNYLLEEEKEKLADLVKYYRDYKITLFDKYKLIAYYDNNVEQVNNNKIYNIYHIVLDNENKFSSFGIYANGILVESTNEAGLGRFSGYEKINKKYIDKSYETKFPIYDKIETNLNAKIIEITDLYLKNNLIRISKKKTAKQISKNKNTTQKWY